jgi:hypothetical protein
MSLATKLLELAKLDLGNKPSERLGCYTPSPTPQVYYPSLYVDDVDGDLDKFPDEGKAVIKYKITRRSTEKSDGKTRKSATIEVQSIGTKLKELSADLDEVLLDARPRDNMGQYEPQQAGGVDPLTLKQAYQTGRNDQQKAHKQGSVGRKLATAAALGLAGYGGFKAGGFKSAKDITKLRKTVAVQKSVESDHLAAIRKLTKNQKR